MRGASLFIAAALAIPSCDSSGTRVSACPADVAASPLSFSRRVLDPEFRGEAVVALDANNDGRLDFATDQFVYLAPDFAPHEIRDPETFDPRVTYSADMTIFAVDLNADGFADLVVTPKSPKPAGWYENPGREGVHWTWHLIAQETALEHPIMPELFGDGRRQLVMGVPPLEELAWLEPSADPTAPWVAHPISPPRFVGVGTLVHGIGAGDVNGDGRADVLTGYGWFEGPQLQRRASLWAFHPYAFCPDNCAEMLVYDVDADGLADVVSASPHGYGVWWWQQGAPLAGSSEPTWTRRLIDESISETHAVRLADLDGDGVPELITGKRYFAHLGNGPGGLDEPELAFFSLSRGSGVTWSRHGIDCDSGVGVRFDVKDFTGDGRPDIVTINKKGLFLFTQNEPTPR